MKILKQILAIGFMFNLALLCAQQQAYVIADNGLTIRDKPDVSSERLGKLNYGDEIEITEQTNIELVIIDDGKKIVGNWVKIKANSKSGYVFNGYLSKEKFIKGIEVHLKGLQIKLKNLKSNDESIVYSFFDKDTVAITSSCRILMRTFDCSQRDDRIDDLDTCDRRGTNRSGATPATTS